MRAFMIILILLFLINDANGSQVFIQYSPEGDNVWLFKYLHGLTNQFFVDIGAYDPTYASNTLPFTDWHGLNVEASQNRAHNFLFTRPEYPVYNFAMSNQSGGEMILYELAEDSGSTVSKQAKQTFGYAKNQPTVKEQKVWTMNLADLCHKYYLKKPKLMTIDIEGYGYAPLSSNDWDNDKCVPDVIIAQDSPYNVASGLPPLAPYLATKGYSRREQIGLNTIYLHSKNSKFFLDRLAEGDRLMKLKQLKSFWGVQSPEISKIAPGKGFNSKHIDMRETPALVYYARPLIISILDIIEDDYFLANAINDPTKKNRPILIMHFNPHINKLLLGSTNYTVEVKDSFQAVITIIYPTHTQKVYIYDMMFEPKINITIIDETKRNNVGQLIKSNDCEPQIQERIIKRKINKNEIKKEEISRQISIKKQTVPPTQSQVQLDNTSIYIIVVLSVVIIILLLMVIRFGRKLKKLQKNHANDSDQLQADTQKDTVPIPSSSFHQQK